MTAIPNTAIPAAATCESKEKFNSFFRSDLFSTKTYQKVSCGNVDARHLTVWKEYKATEAGFVRFDRRTIEHQCCWCSETLGGYRAAAEHDAE